MGDRTPTKSTTMRFPKPMLKAVDEQAAQRGMNRTMFVQHVLAAHINAQGVDCGMTSIFQKN